LEYQTKRELWPLRSALSRVAPSPTHPLFALRKLSVFELNSVTAIFREALVVKVPGGEDGGNGGDGGMNEGDGGGGEGGVGATAAAPQCRDANAVWGN
jgi:hypothetical protein